MRREELVVICDKDIVLCEQCGWFGEMQACGRKKRIPVCPGCAGSIVLKELRQGYELDSTTLLEG